MPLTKNVQEEKNDTPSLQASRSSMMRPRGAFLREIVVGVEECFFNKCAQIPSFSSCISRSAPKGKADHPFFGIFGQNPRSIPYTPLSREGKKGDSRGFWF